VSETFTCDECKREFENAGTEEEAEQEFEDNFGKHMGEERAVLCDDCFHDFMKWYKNTYLKVN
jgi:hypothetical protein